MSDTRRRVKVYTLNEDKQWDDKGTGHVSYTFDNRLHTTTLIVRAENDGSTLLESNILQDTAYQKQQETLIVWSENDNSDLALSFQEKPGCDEIWERICQVQGKDPSVNITQDVADDIEDEVGLDGDLGLASNEPVELPPCELSHLKEIENIFTSCLPNMSRREKLAMAVESSHYIQKLLSLFCMNEDLENLEGLHHLHEIFKVLFMLNKNSIFETLFNDTNIMNTIGCLEYDPSLSERRLHREYLMKDAKFKEVIPISNPELRKKIHQTFRVQYIQDIILPTPSVFEENLLSTLNSFIFFNKIEIVSTVQEDETFLCTLFEQLKDEAQADDRRTDLAGFLRELCIFSQTLQIGSREEFFKALSDFGILHVVESILASDNIKLRQLGVDIFTHVVEYSPSMVRDFAHHELQESQGNDDELLMNLVIEQMICDPDPEMSGAMQLMNILRILLDPENMMANKNEKTEFLSFFYYHCMHVLMAPLLANTTDEKSSKGDYQTAYLLSLILELVTFSVEHHTYHVKNYILNKDLLRRILVLLHSKHRFLALATVRFLRKIISMSDELYNRYIVKGNLLQPVVDVLFRSGNRYNLLNSAVLELFEYIRTEDIKTLIAHIAEKHMHMLKQIDYVKTFSGILQRYEQQKDRLGRVGESMNSIDMNSRFRRDERTMDEEEESWFEAEDGGSNIFLNFSESTEAQEILKVNIDKILEGDGKEDTKNCASSSLPGQTGIVSTVSASQDPEFKLGDYEKPSTTISVNLNGFKANGDSALTESIDKSNNTASSKVTIKTGLVGLVDYDESDDEDVEIENGGQCPSTDSNMQTPDKSNTPKSGELVDLAKELEPATKKPKLQTVCASD